MYFCRNLSAAEGACPQWTTTTKHNYRLTNCLRSVQASPVFAGRSGESKCGRSTSATRYNVVEVEFVDGTSLSVTFFPMGELMAELNDLNEENGKVLKRWPRMIAR